jgi:hypothetical protein
MAARSQNMDKLREEQERAESEDKKRKVSLLSNEEFLKAFDVDLVEGQEDYMAICPAHNDGNPSLSIKLHEHKRLLNCFAGCTSDREGVLEVLSAAGLEERDLYINEVVTAEYIYENEKGNQVFKKVRMEPKGFTWRQKSGNYWIGKITKPWILYKLPEVKYAKYHNRTIFFGEGEKDVENLIKLGLDATTMGAAITGERDKRLKALDPLEGCDVVIVPDQDEAGAKQAKVVSKWLLNHKCSVRILALPEHDISDWLAKGHTKEELQDILADTPYERDQVKYLNSKYVIVKMGGRVEALDIEMLKKDGTIATSSCRSFHEGGEGMLIGDKSWWEHKLRLGVKSPVFKPSGKINANEFNLFTGWKVSPTQTGDCSLFKAHLLQVICKGDEALYKYLWDWIADIFQNPEVKSRIAVALRSDEGSGKSMVGKILSGLLGNAYYVLGDPNALKNGFNGYVTRRLLLHLEEAFFSGDHAVASYLRTFITDPLLHCNTKFVPEFDLENFARILVTSNSKWVVPVGLNDRRWLVIDVSEDHRNDLPYFQAMLDQMANGGYGRLLYELLNTTITSDWSKIPETAAKVEQKIEGNILAKWLDDSLENYQNDPNNWFWQPGTTISATKAYIIFTSWVGGKKFKGNDLSVKAFSMELVKLGIQKKRTEKASLLTFDPSKCRMVNAGSGNGSDVQEEKKSEDENANRPENNPTSYILHSFSHKEKQEMDDWLDNPSPDPLIEPYRKKLYDIREEKGISQALFNEIHKLMVQAKQRQAVLAGLN